MNGGMCGSACAIGMVLAGLLTVAAIVAPVALAVFLIRRSRPGQPKAA
jgi:hypothetical protein